MAGLLASGSRTFTASTRRVMAVAGSCCASRTRRCIRSLPSRQRAVQQQARLRRPPARQSVAPQQARPPPRGLHRAAQVLRALEKMALQRGRIRSQARATPHRQARRCKWEPTGSSSMLMETPFSGGMARQYVFVPPSAAVVMAHSKLMTRPSLSTTRLVPPLSPHKQMSHTSLSMIRLVPPPLALTLAVVCVTLVTGVVKRTIAMVVTPEETSLAQLVVEAEGHWLLMMAIMFHVVQAKVAEVRARVAVSAGPRTIAQVLSVMTAQWSMRWTIQSQPMVRLDRPVSFSMLMATRYSEGMAGHESARGVSTRPATGLKVSIRVGAKVMCQSPTVELWPTGTGSILAFWMDRGNVAARRLMVKLSVLRSGTRSGRARTRLTRASFWILNAV